MSSSSMEEGVLVGVMVKVGVPAYGVTVGVLVGEPAGAFQTKLITLLAGSVYENELPDTATFASWARSCVSEVM